MQPLPSAAQSVPANTAAASNDSGVVLRWRASSRLNGQATGNPAAAANTSGLANQALSSANQPSFNSTSHVQAASGQRPVASSNSYAAATGNHPSSGNPLRAAPIESQPANTAFTPRANSTAPNNSVASNPAPARAVRLVADSQVRPATYQQGGLQAPPNNSILDADQAAPALPGNLNPSLPPTLPPALPPNLGQDELSRPELPPAPPIGNDPAQPDMLDEPSVAPPAQSSADANPQLQPLPGAEELNPFRNRRGGDLESPSDRQSGDGDLEDPKRPDALANCESFRERLRNSSLQQISLNTAPRYGQGLNDDPEDAEKRRLDFAASAKVRDWCDRSGQTIVQGRMVDLLNEQVVLDVNGVRREIPLRDLCDVDMAYVGKAWNLPITCGSGADLADGRSFVPSAIQWKASGLCHKPLYFEEVQLERYGHELGPVLQPLVSTAHFFGNVAILPYKMGIHPPSECQYALGYYRPGNCAPYMVPPVPLSLRGAAVQAGAVVGAAALVP